MSSGLQHTQISLQRGSLIIYIFLNEDYQYGLNGWNWKGNFDHLKLVLQARFQGIEIIRLLICLLSLLKCKRKGFRLSIYMSQTWSVDHQNPGKCNTLFPCSVWQSINWYLSSKVWQVNFFYNFSFIFSHSQVNFL